MSRPEGSSCCDNTVTPEPNKLDVYRCDGCGQNCEVIE